MPIQSLLFRIMTLLLVLPLSSCSDDESGNCSPACPATAVCMDSDGQGDWECYVDTEPPLLACAADSHCPADGNCIDGRCVRQCGCVEDADCQQGHLCVTEDLGCGICLPEEDFACSGTSECMLVEDVSQCCPCPKARNLTARDADPCLMDSPPGRQVPEPCQTDCSEVDRCWPCTPGAEQLTCSAAGLCRKD